MCEDTLVTFVRGTINHTSTKNIFVFVFRDAVVECLETHGYRKAEERREIRPRGYKTFFVLNSVEHEILNVHKYKIPGNSAFLRLC